MKRVLRSDLNAFGDLEKVKYLAPFTRINMYKKKKKKKKKKESFPCVFFINREKRETKVRTEIFIVT
jgi:hypothetical protein